MGAGHALCVGPDAVRGLFDPGCPIAMPRDVGMSLILTSPAYLLVIPAFRPQGFEIGRAQMTRVFDFEGKKASRAVEHEVDFVALPGSPIMQ